MFSKTMVVFGFALVAVSLLAVDVPQFKHERTREPTEWAMSFAYNSNVNKRPRVLLVGDSICNGYHHDAMRELGGVAYVSVLATSKCVTDKTFLRQLAFMLEEDDYAVVHFNNGLHSNITDRHDWELGLRAALRLIKEKAPNAKIIWASSTPMTDLARNANGKELNAIAAKVVAEEGIPTDDLYSLMEPLDRKTNWLDKCHFGDAAKKLQGKAVADSVKKALGANPVSTADAKAALRSASTETGPDGKLDLSTKAK